MLYEITVLLFIIQHLFYSLLAADTNSIEIKPAQQFQIIRNFLYNYRKDSMYQ